MELRHLRYFVAVAEALSFTRGAEKVRIAQPSLTRQIKDLEAELGVTLLNRSKKQVTLTKEGECFLAGAKRLLSYGEEIVDTVRGLSGKITSAINIGYLPNPFHRALPASLALFEKRFPEVSINLFGMPALDQLRAIKEGKLDLGFVGLLEGSDEPDLEFRTVASYDAVLVLPKSHPLGKRTTTNLHDLETIYFVSLSDGCYPGYGRWLNLTCQKNGFKPRILQVAENENVLLQAVRSELGIALLPEQIQTSVSKQVTLRKVKPEAHFGSSVAWRKDNPSKTLRSYMDIITKIGQK